mgnify:CR=1 FL=1
MTTKEYESYYVPSQSHWPIVGAVALFMIAFGAASYVTDIKNQTSGFGGYLLLAGIALVIYMVVGWFSNVINESMAGKYSHQMDNSFRQGMSWFIFSEVMFFAGFFGALFYARSLSVPWLGGEGTGLSTNAELWNGYEGVWPTNGPGNLGGKFEILDPFHLPLINTMLLLTSSVTVTIAHHAIRANNRAQTVIWLAATVLLGAVFMYFQVTEYIEAYHLDLTLESGIYGATFFMLTGFHGMHVTLGTIMLAIITIRVAKGHFKPENHFGFEAVAWYWHFVDVVWLGLFIFVYIL